jgi:hypothetical protein
MPDGTDELRTRVRALEVLVNGNGKPGLAEGVRAVTADVEHLRQQIFQQSTVLTQVNERVGELVHDRELDEARKEGSRKAINQTRAMAAAMIALLGLDLTIGLDALFSLLPFLP